MSPDGSNRVLYPLEKCGGKNFFMVTKQRVNEV